MPSKNDCWGIEIGANAIKAIRLVRSGSQVQVADYAVLPFKKVLTTPDLNVDEAIQVNLDTLLAHHELGKSRVVASVAGHMAFARFAKLPPVEPKKIPDIVRFEAVQQIPFPIDQVEWDYQVFQQEDSPDVEVGIFAITKERVSGFLNNFRRVNIGVDVLTLSPLAVFNAFAYEKGQDTEADGSIYMDIGTQCTDMIIVENGGIWLRTLPIGGNNFTEALVKAFKISFHKAEKLKREAGTSKYARNIFQAMRPVFADLVQEIQRSLGYYQSLNRDSDIKRVVGVGSTFRLPGLQKFLKQQLQLDVVRPDRFSRITVEGKQEADFADNVLNMTTAYGLALQGLELGAVSANILPARLLKQRMWDAKQPWIGAAAACFAIAVGLSGVRTFTDSAAYKSEAEEHDPRVANIVNMANNYKRELEKVKSADPRTRIVNLERILDYNDLWPKILEDVSLAAASVAPQPEMLGVDYEKIRAIPRNQRRRIYIDSIEARYEPVLVDEAGDMDQKVRRGKLGQKYNVDFFFAKPDQNQAATDIEPVAQENSAVGQEESLPRKAPRLIVTVRGTSPYATAPALLDDTFVQWLKDNAQRPDRPYRIVVDSKVLQGVGRLDSAAAGHAGGGTVAVVPRRAASPRRNARRNTNRPMPGTGAFMTRGVPGANAPTQGGAGKIEDLLPTRPLADENRSEDYRFTIVWAVELLRPEQARKAQQPSTDAQPESVTPTEPPQPVEQPEQAAEIEPAADQENQS